MKLQEKYYGSKDECLEYAKNAVSKLVKGILEVENQKVEIPDTELGYKIKYEEDVEGGQVVFKITWSSGIEEEEEEEEEEAE